MATEDKRIDQLPEAAEVDPTSLLVVQRGDAAERVSIEQLQEYLSGLIGSKNAVLYVEQTLTEEQQRQARRNIRCGSVGDVADNCVASGNYCHSEGSSTSEGTYAHSEGQGNIATTLAQHVQGAFNIPETNKLPHVRGKYAHIVGNGVYNYDTYTVTRSNAHTLDWGGVPWYAGDRVMLGGTGMDDENAVALMPIFAPQQLTEEQKQQARENLGVEGPERMELITQFRLTENVSNITISADADGNPFRLERVVVMLNTNGECDAGNSGAFGIYFGNAANPTAVGLYYSGFPFRGYEVSAGKYRNSGFNAYGSVKGGVALAAGHCGDFGAAENGASYVGNGVSGYCEDMKIERITSFGTMPKNAVISVYGVKAVE